MRACSPAAAAAADCADPLDQLAAQVERRDEDLAERARPPEAGDEVEEVGDVGRDLRVGGEQPDVLVDPRRGRVVVAGADVDVALERVAFAPDHERRLGVDLQIREAVDHVDARLLERASPLDVPALVEAGLQLDDADALLAVLGRLDQRRRERRVVARAVHGRLQGRDRGILGGGADEALDARPERVVRVLDDDVGRGDLGEDVAVLGLGEAALGLRHPRLVLEVGTVEVA